MEPRRSDAAATPQADALGSRFQDIAVLGAKKKGPLREQRAFGLVAGAGFEPATFGL